MKRALLAGTVVLVALAAWFVLSGDAPVAPAAAPEPSSVRSPAAPLQLLPEAAARAVPADAKAPAPGGDDATFEVTVTDAEGRPLAGAAVAIRKSATEPAARTATTGTDGRATIGVPRGGWRLHVSAAGYVPESTFEAPRVGAVERRTFALARGGDVRGVVVTPDGVPVAGARVDGVWKREGEPSVDPVPKRTATTGTDGTFALDGIHLGARVVIRITSDAHPLEEVAVTAPDERVRIVLRPGLQVRVRVKEANGQPSIGCIVSLFPAGTATKPGGFRALSWQRGPKWQATGADGTAVLTGVAPGAFIAYARHEVADGGDAGPFGSAKATAEKPTTEVEIRLSAGHLLQGKVVDGAGAAVVGARILIRKGADVIEVAQSEADGTFSPQLFEPPPWNVTALAEGHDTARAEGVLGAVTLVVKKLPALTGRVIDAAGAPVPTFTVNDVEVASSDGRFSVPMRAALRRQELKVSASGHGATTVAVPEGTTDVGDVVLKRGRSVAVTVVDAATQQPIAGAQVRGPGQFTPGMIEDVGRGEAATTDTTGVATLADLGEGAVVQARHADYALGEATVSAGAATARVALERGGVLRLRMPPDRPAGGVELYRYPGTRLSLFQRSKEATHRLPSGRYALRLIGHRPPELGRDVQLVAGRETEVAFGDAQGVPFEVQISGASAHAEVLVAPGDVPVPTRAAEWTWMSAIAAKARVADGVATFPALPAGRVTVFVVAYPGFHRVSADVGTGKLQVAMPPTLARVPVE